MCDYSFAVGYFSRWDCGFIYQIRAMGRFIQIIRDCQPNICSFSSEHLVSSSHSSDVADHFSSRDAVWLLWVESLLGQHRVNWRYFASIKNSVYVLFHTLVPIHSTSHSSYCCSWVNSSSARWCLYSAVEFHEQSPWISKTALWSITMLQIEEVNHRQIDDVELIQHKMSQIWFSFREKRN